MFQELRVVEWAGTGLALIDRTALPHRAETVDIHDLGTLVDAIRRLGVRSAPAVAVEHHGRSRPPVEPRSWAAN